MGANVPAPARAPIRDLWVKGEMEAGMRVRRMLLRARLTDLTVSTAAAAGAAASTLSLARLSLRMVAQTLALPVALLTSMLALLPRLLECVKC